MNEGRVTHSWKVGGGQRVFSRTFDATRFVCEQGMHSVCSKV